VRLTPVDRHSWSDTVSDDVDLMVRDFRSDPSDPARRRNVSYLRSEAQWTEPVSLRVHALEECEALSTQSTDAIDAWARHAAAANGFGYAGISEPQVRTPVSYELWRETRVQRSRAIGEAVAAIVWVIVWLTGSFWRSWQRRLEAAATYEGLGALDDHTLRDLGIDRSELGSVAAEVEGRAARTRLRVAPISAPLWIS
jgi:uncharacterized protein YjiS (DUF1127 family)